MRILVEQGGDWSSAGLPGGVTMIPATRCCSFVPGSTRSIAFMVTVVISLLLLPAGVSAAGAGAAFQVRELVLADRAVVSGWHGRPLSLVTGDLDEDGATDLVIGYGMSVGGVVVVHRGNLDALYPYRPEARQRRAAGTYSDEPFLETAMVYELPAEPELLASADLDCAGNRDRLGCGEAARAIAPQQQQLV